MSTELQDEKSPSELAALWKTIPKTNVVEHRSVNSHAISFKTQKKMKIILKVMLKSGARTQSPLSLVCPNNGMNQ